MSPFMQIFLKTDWVVTLIGFHQCPKSKSKRLHFISLLFPGICIFSGFVSFLLSLRHWPAAFKEWTTDNALTVVLSVWLGDISIGMCYLVYWTKNDMFSRFDALLTDATGQAGVRGQLSKLRQLNLISLYVLIVHTLANFGYMVAVIIFNWDTYGSKVIVDLFLVRDVNLAALLLPVIGTVALGQTSRILIDFTNALACELNHLNEEIENLFQLTEENLKEVASRHTKLMAAVDFCDRMFSGYIGVCFATAIPMMVLLIYTFFLVGANIKETWILLAWCLMMVWLVLLICTCSANVYDKAVMPKTIVLHKLNAYESKNNLGDELFRVALLFIRQTELNSGLTCMGFFIITRGVILTIFSVVLGYIVLLVEMNSNNSNSNCSSSSMNIS